MKIARHVGLFMIMLGVTLSCARKQNGQGARSAPAEGELVPVAGHEAAAEDPCAAKMGAAPEADFTNWARWTKLTAKPIFSRGHGGKYVDVYVDPPFVDAYKAGRSAVGMRICKPNFEDEAGKRLVNLTVMQKMPQGYDPKNGDWWYGVLDMTAATAMSQGKIEMCITCHDGARHDHMFGPAALFNVR